MGQSIQKPRRGLVETTLVLLLSTLDQNAAIQLPVLSPADDLIPWIFRNGGQVGINVASVDADGLRGCLALHDFKQGEIVISIPMRVAINVGPAEFTAAELSVQLLRICFESPERLKFLAPYFRYIPNKSELYSKYLFKREHLPLLQDEQMEAFVTSVLNWTAQLYTGTAPVEAHRTFASLRRFPQSKLVTLEDFSHYAALLDSYSFGFPDERGQPRRWLLPLIDMLNHNSNSNVNVIRDVKTQSFIAVALKDIRKGEEVTYRYSWSIDRNDKALLNYFFLHDRRPPLLCAVDLPAGYRTLWEDIEEPPDDSDHALGGPLCNKEELDRLRQILASFPTSEAKDRALLSSKSLKNWREQMLVQFRVLRKEALRLTIQALEDTLNAPARALNKPSWEQSTSQRQTNVLQTTISEL